MKLKEITLTKRAIGDGNFHLVIQVSSNDLSSLTELAHMIEDECEDSEYGEPLFIDKKKDVYKDKDGDIYDAYCVKCKEKRNFVGKILTSDSGRRMAQGKCGDCGTKLNRVLGKVL